MDLISGLHTFIRVVETGSFSAVAREGNSSQSAVTRQVAQLEEHFGVRLFHRTTRKISLTDEGQDLVTRARHLLEEAEDLEDTFGKNGGSPTGLVRVGIQMGAAILLVADFAALLHRHPGLAVELVVSGARPDLSSGVELAVFRVVQEALTNTRKHAEPGASARVRLDFGQEAIEVTVVDDGAVATIANGTAALGAEAGGHGIAGMKERVAAFGGELEAGPRGVGRGWRVHARVPVTVVPGEPA